MSLGKFTEAYALAKAEEAAQQERAAIVAWLEEEASKLNTMADDRLQQERRFYAELANAIERGDHLKTEGER